MLELYVTVCLLKDPAKCKDVSLLTSEENVTPMQLQSQAQPEIAKWFTEHPGYSIQRWGVRRPGLISKA